MKKTRFLAGLLCMMMLFCAFPVMHGSAAGASDSSLMTAIENVLKYGFAVPVTSTADWIGLNMDFSDNFTQTTAMTVDDGIDYDSNGINFPAGDTLKKWTYTEQVPGKAYSGWSPFCVSKNYTFRFKLEEGGSLEQLAPQVWKENTGLCAHISITEDQVVLYDGAKHVAVADTSGFTPGTDWNDVLVFCNPENVNAYIVYMKKASDDAFTLLRPSNPGGTSFTVHEDGWWETAGLTFKGEGVSVKHAFSVKEFAGTYYSDITDIVGTNTFEDVNLDFDAGHVASKFEHENLNINYSDENGAYIPAIEENVTIIDYQWFYNPTAYANRAYYNPLETGYVRLKLRLTEDGGAIVQVRKPNSSDGRTYIEMSTTGINCSSSGTVTKHYNYVPGTSWAEYLIGPNDNGGYTMYVNSAETSGKWVLLLSTDGWRSSVCAGINITGTGTVTSGKEVGVYLKELSVITDINKLSDSVDEIVGGPVATTYALSMDETTEPVLTLMEGQDTVGIIQDGTYTSEGWKGNSWRLVPTSGWEPLKSDGSSTAVAFSAKMPEGDEGFNVQGHIDGGRFYLNLVPGEFAYSNAYDYMNNYNIKPDNNWADYLITQHADGAGYALYMKSETTTHGKWIPLVTTKDFQTTTGSSSASYPLRGFYFYDGGSEEDETDAMDTLFKDVKIFSTRNAAAEETTLPFGADYLYYEEDFDAEPTYKNYTASGASYVGGNLVLKETPEEEAEVVITNCEIPLGGYAEYRIKGGNAASTMHFYDGTTHFGIVSRINRSQIQSGTSSAIYLSEAGDIYRTWRVLRHTDGSYSAYCKLDGDSSWYTTQIYALGNAANVVPQIKLNGSLAYDDVSDGVTEVDYIKVYGKNPGDSNFLITDGYGTKVLTNGSTATCTDGICINVQQTEKTQTILVAESKNGVLKKLTTIPVAIGTDVIKETYQIVDKTASIRVFLWDGMEKISAIADTISFTVAK